MNIRTRKLQIFFIFNKQPPKKNWNKFCLCVCVWIQAFYFKQTLLHFYSVRIGFIYFLFSVFVCVLLCLFVSFELIHNPIKHTFIHSYIHQNIHYPLISFLLFIPYIHIHHIPVHFMLLFIIIIHETKTFWILFFSFIHSQTHSSTSSCHSFILPESTNTYLIHSFIQTHIHTHTELSKFLWLNR